MIKIRRACLVLLPFFLVACVAVPKKKIDTQKAVDARVAAGLEYMKVKNPGAAREHLSRALVLNDKSPEAQNAMALLYQYEGDVENEERHYKKAISADKHFAPAHNNYGVLLFGQKRYEDALKQFYDAANNQSYGGRGQALENIGRTYVELKKPTEAKEAFNKALRLAPNLTAPLLELAKLYYKEGDVSLADKYYSSYISRTKAQSAEALWLGIRIAADTKQNDRISSYELALQKLYPNSPEFRAWTKWKGASK